MKNSKSPISLGLVLEFLQNLMVLGLKKYQVQAFGLCAYIVTAVHFGQ